MCMMQVRLTTNPWIWNWILVIICKRLLPIFISMLFCWICIQFLFNLGNSLYKSVFFYVLFRIQSKWKFILINKIEDIFTPWFSKILFTPFTKPFDVMSFLTHNSTIYIYSLTIHGAIVWFGIIGNLKW